MLTSRFDYPLPPERIAQRPGPRGASRLLVLPAAGPVCHRRTAELPSLVAAGDLVVVNDTEVIPARLFARRLLAAGASGDGPAEATGPAEDERLGGRVELLLVERRGPARWECLLKPGRRMVPGSRLALAPDLTAEVEERTDDGRFRLRFSQPLAGRLDELGHIPLPPYIRRPDEAADRRRYQTIFARRPGAIAAPTAGLHFTPELVAGLEEAGAELARVTLHVGIGTFKPVSAERVDEHRMDKERFEVPEATAEAIERTRRRGGRVIAVGTTVVRCLESAALAVPPGALPAAGPGIAELFITPPFDFRVTDCLLTNFHLPRSTLLMLVSAFAGRARVLAAYREAIDAGYRFYSYGDAMLAERAPPGG